MKIFEIFEAVKNTAGSNDKKKILEKYLADPMLQATIKMIFQDTYGSQKYHLTKKSLMEYIDGRSGDKHVEDYYYFHGLLTALTRGTISGNEAKKKAADLISQYSPGDIKLLLSIIDKNLKIGVSMDNFNSITGNSIEKFVVSLAKNLDKVNNVDPIDGTFLASRKLDGVRCIAKVHNYMDGDEFKQEVHFISRQGKEFKTLENLIEPVKELTSMLMGHWCLDGECCILDEKGDEHFDWIMHEITRKDHTIENPCYNVFDILSEEEFNMEVESPIFTERYKKLNELYYETGTMFDWPNRIKILEQRLIETQEDFDIMSDKVKEFGWEGFMLRKNVPYKNGRTNDLLKVKKFKDAEYVVKDVIKGVATYNENGHKEFNIASALVIEHKGNNVEVGSGLSKEQRLRWYEHPEEIVGKTITVQYFEETTNKKTGEYSLRFPVLKWVYEGNREV